MPSVRRALLDALAEGPVPESVLADHVGVPRSDLGDYLDDLRADGFDIGRDEAGYRVRAVPPYGDGVAYGLEAPFSIESHRHLRSTNKRARELAHEGREDVVVLADSQTGGRGRRDREWTSPQGGIYLSLVLRPTLSIDRVPLFTLAAAVATADAVRTVGADASIKWPNDVLVDERKLAGILTESTASADGSVAWTVVGVGVNANLDASSLPASATSIREQVGDVDRCEVTRHLLERFDELRATPGSIRSAWRELADTLGRRVRVETDGTTVVGEAVDIEDTGALRVATGRGIVSIAAGDCEHLRPA